MIRDQLIEMEKGFERVKHLNSNLKFAYAIAKNKKIVAGELKCMREALEPSPEFVDYEQKRLELNKKHSLKDPGGNPVIVNRSYEIDPDEQVNFDRAMKKLQKQFESCIQKREEQITQYNDMLKEEVPEDVVKSLFRIKYEDLPFDITVEQLEPFIDLVSEPVEEDNDD